MEAQQLDSEAAVEHYFRTHGLGPLPLRPPRPIDIEEAKNESSLKKEVLAARSKARGERIERGGGGAKGKRRDLVQEEEGPPGRKRAKTAGPGPSAFYAALPSFKKNPSLLAAAAAGPEMLAPVEALSPPIVPPALTKDQRSEVLQRVFFLPSSSSTFSIDSLALNPPQKFAMPLAKLTLHDDFFAVRVASSHDELSYRRPGFRSRLGEGDWVLFAYEEPNGSTAVDCGQISSYLTPSQAFRPPLAFDWMQRAEAVGTGGGRGATLYSQCIAKQIIHVLDAEGERLRAQKEWAGTLVCEVARRLAEEKGVSIKIERGSVRWDNKRITLFFSTSEDKDLSGLSATMSEGLGGVEVQWVNLNGRAKLTFD